MNREARVNPQPGPTFASTEVATFWRYLSSSLDRLVRVLDGRSVAELNWRPPASNSNSMQALATHTLANAQVNILGTLCGQEISRDRDTEFTVVTDDLGRTGISWPAVRRTLEGALAGVTDDSLDAKYSHHWRGHITGREILIIVARHAAEHLGQAELTRDLAVTALSAEPADMTSAARNYDDPG
jgi:hypothetical protein